MAACDIKKIPLDDEVGHIIRDDFLVDYCDEFVSVGEEETCMPRYYENFAEDIKKFEVRDSDIMVCTFLKVGTTWTQEMVWMIMNDLDFEGGKVDLNKRFPYLEVCALFDTEKLNTVMEQTIPDYTYNSIEFTKRQRDPRFIKTHLPFSLLPDEIQNGSKSPKMIYVIRNAKDTCVSYYHHGKILQGWRANLENFANVFMTNRIMYGSFWKHVFGYWERRHLPNLLIITYEDMKKDLPSVVTKVARFLGKELTDEQMEKLCKHLSFESMKNNKAVNYHEILNFKKKKNLVQEDAAFIRSGTCGKYKEELSPDMIKELDAWIVKNISGTSYGEQYDFCV